MNRGIFSGIAVTLVALVALLAIAGCSGGGSTDTTEALPEITAVDYSPLNPATAAARASVAHGTNKNIVVDDDSPVLGENLAWMLQTTEHFAENATQMLEGMVMEDSRGRSLLKTVATEMTGLSGSATSPVMGPHDVVSPTGDEGEGYVAMDFSSFTGCESSGTYTDSVSAGSPLSLTAFVGPSAQALTSNPAFSLCVTDLTEGATAGTVWLRPIRAQAMIGGTIPENTSAVIKTTWDDNYSGADCPFTSCRKFVSFLYDPDGEILDILPAGSQPPKSLAATVYISNEDASVMYVNALMNLSEASTPVTTGGREDLRCFTDNGFGVNAFSSGTEVAGSFTFFHDGAVPTIANGGVVETDDCGDEATPGVTVGQVFEDMLTSFATGACHTATELVTTAECALAPLYTLAAQPSLANIATDAAYPADAPSEYSE